MYALNHRSLDFLSPLCKHTVKKMRIYFSSYPIVTL